MDSSVLHIKHLSIGYGKPIVTNINASLEKSDFCVLLGANGKGKSTLINTIRKTLNSIQGEISLGDRNINLFSDRELSRKTSIVSTEKHFSAELTVSDIIAFGRIPYLGMFSRLSETDNAIINKYVGQLDLGGLIDNKFNQLSDGQKQRVMICRALVQDTPIILLDEPTAHLDIENRIKIFSLLKSIAKEENKTILCSTHEVETGLEHANRVWLIDKNGDFISGDTADLDKSTILDKLFSVYPLAYQHTANTNK